MSRSCGVVIREAFYYRTAKLVEIRNAKLGLLHHSIQFIIIAYVIGWVIIYKQGYQTESKMVPAFFTKVKVRITI
jgi:P2X purinoceptor 4